MNTWIWRLGGVLGGFTFISTGIYLLTDQNCSSVSISGFPLFTATCQWDSTGTYPAWLAGGVSLFAGLVLILWAVFPLIEPLLSRNIERNQREIDETRRIETQQELMNQNILDTDGEPDGTQSTAEENHKNSIYSKNRKSPILIVISLFSITILIILLVIVHPFKSNSLSQNLSDLNPNSSRICYKIDNTTAVFPCSQYPVFSLDFCLAFPYIAFRNDTDPNKPNDFLVTAENVSYWSGLSKTPFCTDSQSPFLYQIRAKISLLAGTYKFVEYSYSDTPGQSSVKPSASRIWNVQVVS